MVGSSEESMDLRLTSSSSLGLVLTVTTTCAAVARIGVIGLCPKCPCPDDEVLATCED